MNEAALKMSDVCKNEDAPANDHEFGADAIGEDVRQLERRVARHIIEGGLLKPGMRFWRGSRLILVGHNAFTMNADAPDPAWVKMLGSDLRLGREVRFDLGYVGNLGALLELLPKPERGELLRYWADELWPVAEASKVVAAAILRRYR